MDLSELERLVEIVKNANIRDLTLRQGDARITIRKAVSPEPSSPSTALVVRSGEFSERVYLQGEAEAAFAGDGVEDAWDTMESHRTLWVTAPLVGVFHPVKPMVGLGARVTAGQVIGVIEAMKIINEVTAPVAGVVIDVQAEDGLPVEYGHPLFEIQPEAQ